MSIFFKKVFLYKITLFCKIR